jgi:hypothetical protein
VLLPCAEAAEDVSPLVSDFFSDEQPDRPATTIAAPPMATTNPRFTSVLLCVVVIRQDRRIISSSMVRVARPDTGLGENVRSVSRTL